MRNDCLVQFSILHFYSEPHELIVVHASSTNKFGAMRCDCLVQFSIVHFYSETHELMSFMHPPPVSLEPRVLIA